MYLRQPFHWSMVLKLNKNSLLPLLENPILRRKLPVGLLHFLFATETPAYNTHTLTKNQQKKGKLREESFVIP